MKTGPRKEARKKLGIKELQAPKGEKRIRRPADPRATGDEIGAAELCVNHLCGCKS